MHSNTCDESLIFPNIVYDLDSRKNQGLKHHPKSIHLYHRLAHLDNRLNNDSFDLKSGGDGDNGEDLMHLLDIYFEEIEQLEKDY